MMNFLRMSREAKLDFITHKNINLRAEFNKSRLHLNRNGSDKSGKNFDNFVLKYKWGPTENFVKSSDFPSTPTQSEEVYTSETNDQNATKEEKQSLRYLRTKIDNRTVKYQFSDNIDILMIMETQLNRSFPIGEFCINNFSSLFGLDRDRNGGGILWYIR